jgi:hypothetical protein
MPERPRAEPEIIPPDRLYDGPPWRTYPFAGATGTHRIYITRLGPLSGALLLMAIGAIAAILLLVFLGALLLWLPLIALVVIVAALAGVWRPLRR